MAKTNKPNPLKHFNDEKAKRLVKAQKGMTAFQDYLKNYPSASPSDTLAGSAPVFDGGARARALEEAKKKTYGNNFAPSTNPKSYTTAKGYFDKEGYDEARAQEKAARIKKDGGGTKDDYSKKIAAGKKAGYVVDQPGAYKKNLTDTAQVTYMRGPSGNYAGVKKPTVKKTGGQTKPKKKK